MYKTILFDFDGTIADDVREMMRAFNDVAPEFHFKPITDEELPALRKLSARAFIKKRLRIPLWRAGKLLRLERRIKEEFLKHVGAISPYHGMREALSELRMNGLSIGVVSSADKQVVENFLRDAGVAMDIIEAGGGTFGKARLLSRVIKWHNLDPETVLYVGDELRDVDACRKAGIAMVGVGWGLNDAEVLAETGIPVASTPDELVTILTTQSE